MHRDKAQDSQLVKFDNNLGLWFDMGELVFPYPILNLRLAQIFHHNLTITLWLNSTFLSVPYFRFL